MYSGSEVVNTTQGKARQASDQQVNTKNCNPPLSVPAKGPGGGLLLKLAFFLWAEPNTRGYWTG
jgi:hypothetical protein